MNTKILSRRSLVLIAGHCCLPLGAGIISCAPKGRSSTACPDPQRAIHMGLLTLRIQYTYSDVMVALPEEILELKARGFLHYYEEPLMSISDIVKSYAGKNAPGNTESTYKRIDEGVRGFMSLMERRPSVNISIVINHLTAQLNYGLSIEYLFFLDMKRLVRLPLQEDEAEEFYKQNYVPGAGLIAPTAGVGLGEGFLHSEDVEYIKIRSFVIRLFTLIAKERRAEFLHFLLEALKFLSDFRITDTRKAELLQREGNKYRPESLVFSASVAVDNGASEALFVGVDGVLHFHEADWRFEAPMTVLKKQLKSQGEDSDFTVSVSAFEQIFIKSGDSQTLDMVSVPYTDPKKLEEFLRLSRNTEVFLSIPSFYPERVLITPKVRLSLLTSK